MTTAIKSRPESFGGIIASEEPPFLAFVDRQFMRENGSSDQACWQEGKDGIVGTLSAPVEIHFACTNRCSLGCSHCYMDAGNALPEELDTGRFREALSKIAAMGIFHVALGGGEALERRDLFDLAAHARSIGLVPNLTTNGIHVDATTAQRMRVFGQVNLSLDGIGQAARTYRDGADFAIIDRAIGELLKAGVSTGINCVVGRNNIDALPNLFRYAAERGISEIELLRYKPSGRGLAQYELHRPTPTQNRSIYPLFQRLSDRYRVRAKIDCSFVPMLCCHHPPRELLEAHCVCGCEAGNYLLGAHSDGRVCGCSFLPALDLTIDDLQQQWHTADALRQYRDWSRMGTEPCASCPYLSICKGGCHAVSLAVCNDIDAPDPDCPMVRELLDR